MSCFVNGAPYLKFPGVTCVAENSVSSKLKPVFNSSNLFRNRTIISIFPTTEKYDLRLPPTPSVRRYNVFYPETL